MEKAEEELERRSKFLNSLILRKKGVEGEQNGIQPQPQQKALLRVRASDMPVALQNRAFRCATNCLDSMPSPKIDSKRLALALKKDAGLGALKGGDGGFLSGEFDSAYGPAWHCIVGTSFGSYVTHSLGGFLYFSIDKIYILLFKTAVKPLNQ